MKSNKIFKCSKCKSKWHWSMRSVNGKCILCNVENIKYGKKNRTKESIYESTVNRYGDSW